jgi:hypothetical protein
MTKLLTTTISDSVELQELLIKNLLSIIKAGNEKHLSNIYDYSAYVALKKCKFINFNSRARISFMVFDIDHVGEKTALEYFKNMTGLLSHISETIGLEPTYILETQKGFHFGYHLKNHIYTHQAKAVEYLRNIKIAITSLLGCDVKASHRLNGIWRNPLLHSYYYSGQINYELSDFKTFLPLRKNAEKSYIPKVKIDESLLIDGNRNEALFKYAMRFAKGKTVLSTAEIVNFLIEVNSHAPQPLSVNELYSIASSVHKYWTEGKIFFGTLNQREPIPNEGIMEFPKMVGLPFEEYEAEVKHRQKLSAQRTNRIKNQEQAKNQLQQARECLAQKRQVENEQKIFQAIADLEKEGLKINVNSISKKAGIDRRTVKKYYPH